MPAAPSRHDHFPRADPARRAAIRAAVSDLGAAWTAADTAPDGLLTAIDAQTNATPDAAIAALLPWLTDPRWLTTRLASALALLRTDPFARPPLRPVGGADGAPGGLVLAERGAVRLTLRLWPFATHTAAPAPAIFVPGRAVLHVLASGGAQLCLHQVAVTPAEETGAFTAHAAAPCDTTPPRPLHTGALLHLDTARQSFSLIPGARDTLLLELAVQPPSRLPIRSYDPATGRLRHVSASSRDSSFRAMALTLLRHLGRTDAAPLFEAETQSTDFAARWYAMRELVALRSAAARAPLTRMAAHDPHPEVRAAAKATLALLPSPPLQGRAASRGLDPGRSGVGIEPGATPPPPPPTPPACGRGAESPPCPAP